MFFFFVFFFKLDIFLWLILRCWVCRFSRTIFIGALSFVCPFCRYRGLYREDNADFSATYHIAEQVASYHDNIDATKVLQRNYCKWYMSYTSTRVVTILLNTLCLPRLSKHISLVLTKTITGTHTDFCLFPIFSNTQTQVVTYWDY